MSSLDFLYEKRHYYFEMRKSDTAAYKSWESMKSRCLNPNSSGYNRYGGRGITVCQRWIHSFDDFLEDMGERPQNCEIHRKDNNKNYEKENCIWLDKAEHRKISGYSFRKNLSKDMRYAAIKASMKRLNYKHQKYWYSRMIELGNCGICGKEKENISDRLCQRCRENKRKRDQEYRLRHLTA